MGYLNYYDPIYFTNKVFLHKACAQDVPDTTNALGGILCLWNDVRVDDKTRITLHNGMINGMMPFTDEQFYWMREPVTINLKKGDNEIKLYIPKTFKGQRWSFGMVKTTRQ